jgi:outer membrane protein assembly factor BamB
VVDAADVTAHLLTPDALHLARPGVVEARPLVPGGPRWSAEVATHEGTISLEATTIVVRPARLSGAIFLDAATGRIRWRTPELSAVLVLGDRVAVADTETLRMLDLATGRVRWERPAPAIALDTDAGHRYLLGLDRVGRATVYSAADGATLTTGPDLGVDPYLWGLGEAVGTSDAKIVKDILFLYAPTSVAAYRLRDLAPLWEAPAVDERLLGPCGDLICTTGDRGAIAFEPATGKVRWTSPRWRSIAPDGLAVAVDHRVARIDPATGRVREELGRGELAGDLLLRYDGDRTFVTGLSDGAVLGSVPVTALSGCATAGSYLACPTDAQAVTVWRVDRGTG